MIEEVVEGKSAADVVDEICEADEPYLVFMRTKTADRYVKQGGKMKGSMPGEFTSDPKEAKTYKMKAAMSMVTKLKKSGAAGFAIKQSKALAK